MLGLLKFFVMMWMVVVVAAAVSAMMSGAMGLAMKKMPMMKHKMMEKMERAEEPCEEEP